MHLTMDVLIELNKLNRLFQKDMIDIFTRLFFGDKHFYVEEQFLKSQRLCTWH